MAILKYDILDTIDKYTKNKKFSIFHDYDREWAMSEISNFLSSPEMRWMQLGNIQFGLFHNNSRSVVIASDGNAQSAAYNDNIIDNLSIENEKEVIEFIETMEKAYSQL